MWINKKVLVTGGASFIGSHLVDALLKKRADIIVADDFSSGRLENLQYPLTRRRAKSMWIGDAVNLTVYRGDLKDRLFARRVMEGIDVVFHLAALHGGRGYIDSHPAECSSNMALDQIVFEEAHRIGVERICYASSACVYPSYLQDETGSSYLLKEDDADPFVRDKAFADLEYGWAKLMGEMTLKAYHRQYRAMTSSARIFTAYGPRENETHAVIALIAKTFVRMDPYVIWGTGRQDRNFTYVRDIVEGMIRVAENITDGSAINIGREDRITLDEAAELIFEETGWRPNKIIHDLSRPQGVASRAADLSKSRRLLGWEPKVTFQDGLAKTIEWYFSRRSRAAVRKRLDDLLVER